MEVKALQQMLSQFRQVQENLEKQMDGLLVEASAGGGMVTVKMNGQKQLTEVRIEPEVFKSKDQEMLQELILAAVNDATRRVDEELSKQVKDLAGGMPGVMGLKIPGLCDRSGSLLAFYSENKFLKTDLTCPILRPQ
jgi:nucleoid-associated protein EbfC